MSYEKPNNSNSSSLQLALSEFKITEEEYKKKLRSNSCIIPSFQELANCLDFVPKLK